MKKLIPLVIMGAAMCSCSERQPEKENLPETLKEYLPLENAALEQKVTKELQIKDVQHSTVSFGDFTGEISFAINHDFVYVMAGNPEEELVLIYPHSKGIRRAIADITYRPLKHREISSKEFVMKFINADFMHGRLMQVESDSPEASYDHFPIEADGIIIKGGIKYK